jgi:hypothetical protein
MIQISQYTLYLRWSSTQLNVWTMEDIASVLAWSKFRPLNMLNEPSISGRILESWSLTYCRMRCRNKSYNGDVFLLVLVHMLIRNACVGQNWLTCSMW